MKNFALKIIFASFAIFLFWPEIALAQPPLQVDYPRLDNVLQPRPGMNLEQLVQYLYQLSLVVGVGLATAVIIYAGIQYLTSIDNPTKVSEARSRIITALIGLLILFGSFVVLRTIDPRLTTGPMAQLPSVQPLQGLEPPVFEPQRPRSSETIANFEEQTREMLTFLERQILDWQNLIFALHFKALFDDLEFAGTLDCNKTNAICEPVCLTPTPAFCKLKRDIEKDIMAKLSGGGLDLLRQKITQLVESKQAQALAGTLQAINTCMADSDSILFINRQAELSGDLDYLKINEKCSTDLTACLNFYCFKK